MCFFKSRNKLRDCQNCDKCINKLLKEEDNDLFYNFLEKYFKIYNEKKRLKKLSENNFWNFILNDFIHKQINSQFIEKYLKYFDINVLSSLGFLDLDFIEKYKKILKWKYISKYNQNITEDFCEKYKDFIWWDYLANNLLNKHLRREYKIQNRLRV